jgi:23S rRNA pseudouridine1911/1915/1917 synthase
VVARLLGVPRADVQRSIASGDVRVDGELRPKSFRLTGGERLEVTIAPVVLPGPEDGGVPLRYEDGDLAVVAKPAGLVTHPTVRRTTGTLVNRLLGMGVALAPAGGALRPGIGTSGLLIVAKHDEAFAALQAMMRRHEVDRRYLALVRGKVEHDAFGVEAPLGRRAEKIVVDHVDGRSAATVFEVRERLPNATLLEAAPRTGRTHQIRVHLAAVGLPILGDATYGGAGDDARALGLRRPFLHAWRLGFTHPISGRRIDLEEPLPADLLEALARARRDLRP